MQEITRTEHASGLSLTVRITFDGRVASGTVAIAGDPAGGNPIRVEAESFAAAVQEIMTEVRRLADLASSEYRAARLRGWTARLVAPVSASGHISAFDCWLLNKLIIRCAHFEVDWTPLEGHEASFRLVREGQIIKVHVAPAGYPSEARTNIVSAIDAYSVMSVVRGTLRQFPVSFALAAD